MKKIKNFYNLSNMKSLIGNTPIIKVSSNIYAKLETYNPTGSVKDRMIHYIVDRARIFGRINEDSILCEATSGNSGISLSAMSAALGLECVIFMPKNMSQERKDMMTIFGAKIIEAPENDFAGALAMRDQYLLSNKRAWSPKQFTNNHNILCHQINTAPEIHKQVIDLKHKWSAFIHGAGTGGTIEGLRRYITNNNLRTKVCLTKPKEEDHNIQGIGDGKDFLFDSNNADRIFEISTEDAELKAKEFLKKTGILVGISSGANLVACERYVKSANPDGIVVTMLCDRGERYMSIYSQKTN